MHPSGTFFSMSKEGAGMQFNRKLNFISSLG